MGILSEISELCEKEYVATLRAPVVARLPKVKFDQMFEEMKGCMRMPPREEVYGELESGGYGWRLETTAEYTARINKKPIQMTLHLTMGILTIIPYNGTKIEVDFEPRN